MSSATISPDGLYRYRLERDLATRWERKRVLFVMLNPSTADWRNDDPTIRRCLGFARSWGYDALDVGNLFAFRSTKPVYLQTADDPIGEENDFHLQDMAEDAALVVAAWGAFPRKLFAWRIAKVTQMLRTVREIHCLGLTTTGDPRHPLYVPAETMPVLWQSPLPLGTEFSCCGGYIDGVTNERMHRAECAS